MVTDPLTGEILAACSTPLYDPADVAGKTGTGEKPGENGRYLSDSFTNSFIGFAPASAPRIQVSVMLDGTPYSAYASAAPTFSKIMKNSLGDLGIAPQ